jgi:hypothetical protein
MDRAGHSGFHFGVGIYRLADFRRDVRLQNAVDDARNQIAEAVRATEERDKNKSKAKSASGGTSDRKEDKKSGSDELSPLWCASPSKAADTSPSNGRAVQPELSPVAQPVPDGEQPEF